MSIRKTFIQVEFAQQCLHFLFVVKQRPLLDKLEKKRTIICCLLRKKCITKNQNTLFYETFFRNE